MFDFITKWLASFLEKFKAKNPKIWAYILAFAMVLQFGIVAILPGVEVILPGLADLPPEFLSLDWILTTFEIHINDRLTDIIMFLIMAITGSKTTAFLPPAKREEKIEATIEKIEEVDSVRTQRQLKRAARQAAKGL